jgi:hypothetical protein
MNGFVGVEVYQKEAVGDTRRSIGIVVFPGVWETGSKRGDMEVRKHNAASGACSEVSFFALIRGLAAG